MTEFILCPYDLKMEKKFLEIIVKGDLVATIYDDGSGGIKIKSNAIIKIEIDNNLEESVISMKLKSRW